MKKSLTRIDLLALALLSVGLASTAAPPPQCIARCATTTCSNDNDCTAAPGGTCNRRCSPGCCVYP